MSEVKFTPGPWEIDSSDQKNHNAGIISIKQGVGLNYESVTTIYPCRLTFEQSLANAKLMSFAPELLTTLENIVQEYSLVLKKYNDLIAPELMDYQTISEAQEVIKKATS